LLLIHVTAYLGALLVVVQQGLFNLYLGCAFAPTTRACRPSPRPNLRRARPLIQAFCQQHDLPYTEASLFGSYAQAVRHLHAVGAPLRPAQAD
jgi:hypothetical protein